MNESVRMRWWKPAALLAGFFAGLLVGHGNPLAAHRPEEASPSAPLVALPELQPGDLIFRRGRSLESRAVLLADPEAVFSHVAIVLGSGSRQRVAHSIPRGDDGAGGFVRADRIEEFLSWENASSAGVFRLSSNEPDIARAAARAAERFVAAAVPFDDRFDLEEQHRLYCTELVWAAYLEAGVDLSEGRRELLDFPLVQKGAYLLPGTLTQSSKLKQLEGPRAGRTE